MKSDRGVTMEKFENEQEPPEKKHHGVKQRIRKKKKSKPWKMLLLIIGILLIAIIVTATAIGLKVYNDVKGAADDVHESIDRVEPSKRPTEDSVDLEEQDSFSVLLLGVDTGALGRTEQGRSDSIMVATVNPSKKTSTLISVPRDIYTESVGHGTSDKLNHAYAFGGAAMSIASVENLLDVPIDHYIQINMEGIANLVDAVGGVEVQNKIDFTYEETHFSIGPVMLDGETALKYSRMRYDDPNGDFGRQGRQRMVIEAIVKKALTIDNMTKYQAILDAVSTNMKTDLTWEQMKELALNYQDAFTTLKSEPMSAPGGLSDGSYGTKNIYYELPTDEEIARIHALIMGELNLDVTQGADAKATTSSTTTELK